MKKKGFVKIVGQFRDGKIVTAACAMVFLFMMPAAAAPRQVMHGHVPAMVAGLKPVGKFAGTNHLNLAIGLPLRNQEALTHLLREIYDPVSPSYHHYLTPQQFTEQFGPTEKDYQAVIAFAKANGLTVTGTDPTRMLVDASGSVADIERAFAVTLRVYQHPTEKRMFHAPDAEPSLDLAVPILRISGLDNYSLPRPRLQATPLANASKTLPNAGSGPGSTYMGKDFRAAYVPDSSLNGSGQIVGLLQFDGYTASDITYYENQAGVPSITLSNVLIDGATGNPSGSGGEVEVSLDIEMAISMATNLSKVMVYMAPNPSPWEDLLKRMANDNLAKQLSCSWYEPGGAANTNADQIFLQMAAQGQSFFSASGDSDAYTGLIPFPGDTPYITQVGGTTLTTTGPGGSWVSETVWNWGNGIGSGGGISTQYPIPSWQTNINMTANQGSMTMRNTPDVALTAANVYVRADGLDYNVGGTSCAAPLWAGFAALVNQQAAASGKPAVGFINPAVDAIGSGVNYISTFHDITTGNNTSPSSPTKFYAVSGYDLCTGWGTPAGQNLINALANPEVLLITPAAGFASIGGVGGPFTITSQSLSLTNTGTNSLTWTLANTSVWLNASPSGGTLTPGGPATTVTASLNTAASNLLVGTYNATMWFTNMNDSIGQSRQFTLAVISPPTITAQPADQAVLEGATATFTVAATGGLPLSYQWQDNGTNLTDGGNVSGSTTTNLTINNVSAANVGAYSVIVTNVAGVAASSNALLTITPSPPVIILQPMPQTAVVGETVTFTVAAIGSTPFFYQWAFNGTNISNATNASLVVANVQLAQVGNYAVLVTNAYGSTNSSNAMLNVYTVPVVTSFNPQSGIVGTVVNISGLNFDPTPGNNIVYLGAVRAAVTAASTTNLVVTVPPGASYAPITVTVNGLTAYAKAPFLVTFTGSGVINSASLTGRVDLACGNGPYAVVIADLDGDGKPDLAVNNYSSGTISIYRNISTNGSLTAGSFAPRVDLATGTSTPLGMVAADVDGDGKLDLVLEDHNANRVVVLRNLSTPGNLTTNSFAAPVYFPVGPGPNGVAVQDLDGDGKPEIVTANYGGTTVSVLRNIGTMGSITTNSFAPAVSFTVGPTPVNVMIADVDGDGKADVVTVNNGNSSQAMSVLRNLSTLGNIAFATNVNFPGLSTSYSLAVGDLNGDGKLDVVIGSQPGGQAVSVYRNTSTPGSITTNSFAAHVDFAAGGWANSVAIGDLDGDGKPDVAVVTQIPSHLSLFKNVSTPGSFTSSSFAARVDFSTGSNPNGVAIGDLDGDGRPDIVFGNQYDNTISVYQNQVPFGGPPVITTQPTNQTVAVGNTATFTVVASGTPPLSYQWNFNGTNIVGATNTSLILTNVQLNQTGNYAVLVTNTYGSVTSSNAVLTVLTVNPPATNVPVIFAFSPISGGVGTSVTISGTNFSPVAASNIVYLGAVRAVVTAASTTNLVVTVPAGATYAPITVTVNGLTAYAKAPFLPTFPSAGVFTNTSLAGRVDLACGNGPYAVVIADLDGDGKPDLAVNNYSSGTISIYRNISTNGSLTAGSFAPRVDLATGTSAPLGMVAADVDGDGKLDLVLEDYNANRVVVLRNLSTPGNLTTNSFGAPVYFPVGPGPSGVAVQDLDGDGKPEIVTANYGGTTVSVLRNIGTVGSITTNSFASAVSFTVGPTPVNVMIADVDGDGKADVVTVNNGNSSQAMSVLRNLSTLGNIAFATNVDFPGLSTSYSLAVGDLDGDGKPDVVIGSQPGGQAVSVFRNTSTPGSITTNSFAAHVDFAAGGWVNSVAIGDLDGDGKPDVVAALQSNSQLDVFKNTSTPGSFTRSSLASPIVFSSGSNPNGVAIGDLDGDGRPDIIFGNQYNNTISIYRNVISMGVAPVITSQPTNQTVTVGNTATFTVVASGTPPLSYQWNFNGTNLIGATNTSLILTNVQLDQTGNYAVLVTNAYGSILSSNAVLTVLALPPSISIQPTNQTVFVGGSATFSVTATGTAPLSYQWNFNGTNMVGATNTTLTLTNVQFSQAGNYAVLVTNFGGSILSSNATLTVLAVPPAITQQPVNQTTVVGGNATFSAAASGTAPLIYQWQFNGTNISGATNTTLTLTNVQLIQAGNYALQVTNVAGTALSSNAVLTVNPPLTGVPVITSFNPQSGIVGTVVNISGLNFDPTPSNNIVYLGAVRAAVTAASTTNLVVTVLAGASYAPITETVNGLTAYANSSFLPTFPGGGTLSSTSLGGPTNLTAGSGPVQVVIGDLDGDGKPDVIVANDYDGTIYIYRNISTNGTLGTASFASPAILTTGSGSGLRWLTLADLDGDGRLDIVVVNQSYDSVSIFQNQCSPGSITTNSFGARVDFSVGPEPSGVAVRDLDGDGKPEIVTANYGGTTVSVLRNIGTTGSITTNSFAPAVSFTVGPTPVNVMIADVDGDGKADIVTVNNGNSSQAMSVLRNLSTLGNIAFATNVDFPGLSTSYCLAVGDLDGDGKLDVVIGSQPDGQSVSVYRNTSTPGSITTNSFAAQVDFAAGGWANSVVIGDLDGDGKPDVAVVTQIPDQLSLFKNVSTPGSFTSSSFAARVDFSAGWNPIGVAIGDLDGDGRPDIVFANQYDGTISIYQNEVPFGGPPSITSQPANQTMNVGGAATFTVVASGTPPLSYQWNFNGTNIDGATNTTLTLTNVQVSQAGNYAVLVTNVYGSVLSSNAVLTVTLDHFTWSPIPSPRFINTPFAVTIQAQDMTNGLFTNFTGTAILGTTNGVAVTPPVSGNFIQGAWTGSVVVSQTASNLVLQADDGLGHFGLANPINVISLPRLGMLRSGNIALYMWPVGYSGFVLETSGSLSPATWVTVPYSPIQIGDQYLLPLDMSGTNGFYRLWFPGP